MAYSSSAMACASLVDGVAVSSKFAAQHVSTVCQPACGLRHRACCMTHICVACQGRLCGGIGEFVSARAGSEASILDISARAGVGDGTCTLETVQAAHEIMHDTITDGRFSPSHSYLQACGQAHIAAACTKARSGVDTCDLKTVQAALEVAGGLLAHAHDLHAHAQLLQLLVAQLRLRARVGRD